MPNTEDRQVLRHLEMIARVRPSRESTQRALDRVRRQLVAGSVPKASTGPRIIRLITSHPAIKAAIAACIVVAMTLTLVVSRSRPSVKPVVLETTGSIPTGKVVTPEASQLARDLQTQLQQVETLYSARDVEGLMGLLDQGAFEAKVAAAQRLAELRDPRAIETLSRLAMQWTAGPDRNPFENAIRRIQGQEAVVTPVAGEVGATRSAATTTVVAGSADRPVLSGLVTDIQSGQPISDVGIQIVGPQVYVARTGTDGSYRLDTIEQAGDYRLQVQSTQYLGLEPQDPCGVVALGPDTPVVRDIRLERGCRVDVQVMDEDGQPIKDVRLSAHWLGSDQDNDAGQPGLTGQDGRATVGALRPSEVSYQITAVCDDYALQQTTVTCSDPNRVDPVRVTLHKGVAVPGYAQYADGTPAQGIQIYAIPDWWHANALPTASAVDGAGNFVLGQIQAGLFSLHVSVPQGDGLAYSFRLAQAQLPTTDGQPLVVTIPQQAPQGLALLSGTIRWSDHRRPDYIDLMAYCFPGTIARTRLQPQVETFALAGLKPGLYTLVFEGPNVEDKIIQGVQAPGSDLEVALQYVPTPRLRGIVLTAGSGQPVERFNVAVMKTRSWPGLMYLPETQWHSVSDPNGLFEISTEGPGQYEVQVIAEGFVPAVLDRVDTRKPRQLVVELSRGGRIKGQVVNAVGEPISGAVIVPLIGDQVGRSVGNILRVREQAQVRSVQGEFVLDHVPAGLHGLRVTHPQFSAITLEGIEVLEGRTTEGVRATLRVGGVVEGTAFDAQGRPQANITLTFHDGSAPYGPGHEDAGLLATVVTDDQGHYRVERLPSTLCFVQRRNPDAIVGCVRRAVWPIEAKTLRLDLGGRPNVTGILALKGQPTADCLVLLADPANPLAGVFQCRATTQADGWFAFSGVPTGRYAVYYQSPVEWGRWIKVAPVEVGTEDLNVGRLPDALGCAVVTLTGAATTDWTVYLQEGSALWGQRVGEVTTPVDANQPYRITQVLPGSYLVVAQGPEGTPDASRQVTRAVEVRDPQTPLDITLEIPSGTGSVSGAVLNEIGGPLFVFSQDRTLSVRLESRGGYYQITNLPAGDYLVGSLYLMDKAPLARFHLADGENKILDINTWRWPGANQGLLSIQVASTSGRPLNDATVWLEGPAERISPLVQTDREQVLIAPAGAYILHVSQPGFQPQQRPVTIQANDLLALVPARPVIQILLEPELSPSNEP